MAEAQKIPLSLRKGYLRANLLYILDDVLKTYIFVTADYLAEQYKIVFQTPLETALQTCDADLFSFIQDEFADTFFVHQESDPRGFLRRTGINKPLPVTQNAPTKAIGYEKSAVSPVPRAVEVDLDYDSGSQYSRPSSRAPIVTEELCSSPSASSLNTSRADLIIEQHITVPKEEPADFVEELRTDFANVGIGAMRSRTRSQSSKEGVAPVPEVSADISLNNKQSAESSVTVYIRQENAEIPRSSQLSPLSTSISTTSMPSSTITKLSDINCSTPTPPPDYIVQYDYVPLLPAGIDHHLPNMQPPTLMGPGPIFRPPNANMLHWDPSQGPSPNPFSFPPFVPLAARFPSICHSFGVLPPGIGPIHPGFRPLFGQTLIPNFASSAAPYAAPVQHLMNNPGIRLMQYHQHPGLENQFEPSRRERRPMTITTPPSSPSPPQEWGRTSSTWSTNGLPVIGRTDEQQGGPGSGFDPEESQVTIVHMDDPEGANVVLPDPDELPESIGLSEQDSGATSADNTEPTLSQEKASLLNLNPECSPESEERTLEKTQADSDRENDLEFHLRKEFNSLSVFPENSAQKTNVKDETSATSNIPFQNLINFVTSEPKTADPEVNASIPIPASGSARKSLSVDTPPPGFGMPQKPPGFEIPQKPPGFELPQKPPGFGMLQKPPGFDDVAPVRTPSATSASASTVDVNENQDENVPEETERKASPDDTAGLLKFLEDVNKKREENEREANGAENVRQTAEIGETAYSPQNDASPENDRHGGDQTPDLVRTTKPYYDPDFEEDYDDYAAQNGPVVNGYAANDNADDVRASSPQSFKKEESPVIQSKRVTELHYKLDDGYIEIYDSIYRHKKQMEKWGNESIPTSWLSITHLGDVLAILRRLNKLYPDGCTAMELYEFDNTLRTSNDSAISSLPSMACVIENGMLEVENQRFHVCAQALNTGIIQLRKNLCSNLYRILRNHNNTLRVKNVIESWNELVCMSFAKPAETIIKVCNRYPLVFQLKSNRAEQYCFETSSLYITEGLSDWRVVLDCETNDMPGILCDCAKCM
ncbi:hypothetical protein Ddc_13890 [Ditylenchus destructor]|nr:hypothetical protein Ddc_13890 [Ditylenchus destructor]